MMYLEHTPLSPLAPWVRMLWYVRAPDAVPGRERVLPNGDMQIVMNLAREFCTGCGEDGSTFRQAPSLAVGIQRRYGVIDSCDLAEMVGVVFAPGGMRRFVDGSTADFSFAETDLGDVWGRGAVALRERLIEAPTPSAKFKVLESELLARLRPGGVHPAVLLALEKIRNGRAKVSVRDLCAVTGYSSRRLGQLFEDEVGVGPKMLARILRFQRAVQRLHAGCEMRWDELALDCGYCDQSHFANDFRDFSGMSLTAYSQSDRAWANHVRV
jgi:AraC-like DNA-binding protein